MTTSSLGELTTFPPFDRYSPKDFPPDKRDSPFEFTFESNFADDGDNKNDMASDDSPFIKSEPNDFGSFDPNHFMQFPQGQQHSQFNQNAFTGNGMNVNPANLTNGNSMSQSFNQQGNMGSSFNMGNAGIADDELSDLVIPNHEQQRNNGFDFGQNMRNYVGQQQQQQQLNHSSAMFSHTPDGAPIQSPFTTEFGGYNQFRNNTSSQSQPQQSGFSGAQSLPQQAGNFRPALQNMDRKISESRSPATPSMQLGDDFGHTGMQQIRHSRQSNSLGGNGWDSTPSGGHSWNDNSPFASPQNGHPMHNQITEVLRNTGGKVASSLPAKMEGGGPTFQSQEAKRRRRRESHNLVERRRRDNINERIHDLGQLVPQHRLEDEKVRKHLQTNAPLSPSITNAGGISPPSAATSLLAGPQARRATGAGSITQGLPLEDKDKGPNKGDILNGSVAWTRDLMWYMHMKLRQEQELKDLVSRLGGEWPFESGEEERRMHSEICEILNKHAPAGGFTGYSRAAGSGLRVPGFTNIAGDSANGDGSAPNSTFPPQGSSLSPGFPTGGSGTSASQQAFWGGEFKEEDEYGMELQ